MKTFTVIAFVLLLSACKNNVQIGENTFIHEDKIYKIIDNEPREIGDLSTGNIKKFEVFKPKQRDFGNSSLSFVKQGATTSLKALYRGNYLYYSLRVEGLNDLRDNYSPGMLTIEFIDEYGFIMHSTEVASSDLVGLVGEDNKPQAFVYNGRTEMSVDINAAIKSYNVVASIKPRTLV